MSSSLRPVLQEVVWIVLGVCLLLDGPIFVDLMEPPRAAFADWPSVPEHPPLQWLLFAGFVVLQGLLVVAAIRLRDPVRSSPIALLPEKEGDAPNDGNPKRHY
jgi:hypothetical protein